MSKAIAKKVVEDGVCQHREDDFYTDPQEGYPINLPPAALCENCQKNFSKVYRKPYSDVEVEPHPDLSKGFIKKYCEICARWPGTGYSLLFRRTEDSGKISVCWKLKSSWVTPNPFMFMWETESPPMQFRSGLNNIRSTADGLPLCKLWLEDCVDTHSSCNSSASTSLPTRLLCISEDKVYLKLTEPPQLSKYATLSHCWGDLKFNKLTKSNISSFKIQIPPSALPKTFQHAIKITKYLGLEYLWIDSLCIIQDDPDDWAKEASLMSTVYSQSHINLAASGATNASVGLFFQKNSNLEFSFQGICLGGRLQGKKWFYFTQPRDFGKQLLEGPLSMRGWAIQERFLPPRTIYFTEKEIVWNCYEKLASEVNPPGPNPYSSPSFQKFFLKVKNGKPEPTMQLWATIVDEFTRCALTKIRDKLVAISGIAKIFQPALNDEYVAGMWRKDLVLQLLWRTFQHERSMEEYVAPSWSWASTNGQIRYNYDSEMGALRPGLFSSTRIENLDICYKTSDSFGEIESASLRMSCLDFFKVQSLRRNFRSGTYSFRCGNREDIEIRYRFDPYDFYVEFEEYVFILPLTYYKPFDWHVICGLLFQPTSTKSGQYKRIGMFEIWGKEECISFRSVLQRNSGPDDPRDYISVGEEDGRERYVVEII